MIDLTVPWTKNNAVHRIRFGVMTQKFAETTKSNAAFFTWKFCGRISPPQNLFLAVDALSKNEKYAENVRENCKICGMTREECDYPD